MISPGFIETSGAKGMIAHISRGSGISEDAARQRIMDMLGGIPIGRTVGLRMFFCSCPGRIVGHAEAVVGLRRGSNQ